MNTTEHSTGAAVLPVPVAETGHERLKRLSHEISDLLNDLDPIVDFVSIRPSKIGKGAVFFGFDLEDLT